MGRGPRYIHIGSSVLEIFEGIFTIQVYGCGGRLSQFSHLYLQAYEKPSSLSKKKSSFDFNMSFALGQGQK